MHDTELIDKFGFLKKLTSEERIKLLQSAVYSDVSAGTVIVNEKAACRGVTFVLSGEFRIFKVSDSGKEIALYNVRGGETCILTISCLYGDGEHVSPVSAVAVQDSRIVTFPADTFRYIFSTSPYLQQYIFKNMSEKIFEMIDLVDQLSFKNVTERLTEYIMRSTGSGRKPIYITHSEIAARLGTSREVVTRKLKELESEGLIKTERGKITFINPKA